MEVVNLVINLELYGFENTTIHFVYKIDYLEYIDRLTLMYLNEEQFFQKNKKEILRKLCEQKKYYQLELNPIDIEMCEEKIYIIKENKKIRALFQEISYKNNRIPLENIIINIMLGHSLTELYESDLQMQLDYEYLSLFKNLPKSIMNKLKLSSIFPEYKLKIEDIEFIWTELKKDNRIYIIIRLLLANENKSQIMDAIKNNQIKSSSSSISHKKVIKYRFPYKDD